jgi:hypothetical protein
VVSYLLYLYKYQKPHKQEWCCMQEARRQRMLQLHFSQKPGLAKPCMLLISTVREVLLLDSDHQTLQWLRHFNPVFCKTAAGEAALLLTKEFGAVRQGHVNNSMMRSRYIQDKAGGAPRMLSNKRQHL